MTISNDEFHVLNKLAQGRLLFLGDGQKAFFMGFDRPEALVSFDTFIEFRINKWVKASIGSTPEHPVYEITHAGAAVLRSEKEKLSLTKT